MASIKNFAIIGALGDLGAPVLAALIASKQFNITIITRVYSKATFPSLIRSEKVISLDYTDLAALTEAFKGQDAVISTVGAAGTIGQLLFIDAAIAAGVQGFLPAEFGSDMSNEKCSAMAVFGYKMAVRKYMEEKIVGTGLSYTYIINGIFLDWGVEKNFLLNFKPGNKTVIYGSGDQLFAVTTLASIGETVVGTLNHLEKTKNRSVRIQDAPVS